MDGREYERIVKDNIDTVYRIALSHTKTPADADDVVFEDRKNTELYEAIRELPAKYRVIVYLFYYEGYATKEISEIIHIKEATVRTRLVTARKMLRAKLKEAWEDEE